jgi:hypothetical protein
MLRSRIGEAPLPPKHKEVDLFGVEINTNQLLNDDGTSYEASQSPDTDLPKTSKLALAGMT